MSFKTMNKENLLKVSNLFELEGPDESWSNEKIRDFLAENKVTYVKYKKAFLTDAGELAPVVRDVVVLKMERRNPTFEVFGHKFTRSHPYAPMSLSDANQIIENFSGFRYASDDEIKKYYDMI